MHRAMDGATGRIEGRDANASYANIIRSFHRRYLKRTTLFSPAGIRQKVIPLKAATDAPGPNRTCPAPDALFAVVRVALTIALFGGFLGATSQGRAGQPFESVGVTYGQAKVIPGECNGNSQGDPIVIYDWLSDRFVLTWFAFASGSGPFYQCIAAAKSSDPVSGGWWLYAVHMDPGTPGSPPVGDINDYGKFGLWHDCLYMAANEFTPAGAYDGIAFASFSRTDLYSGAPLTYSLGYLSPASNA